MTSTARHPSTSTAPTARSPTAPRTSSTQADDDDGYVGPEDQADPDANDEVGFDWEQQQEEEEEDDDGLRQALFFVVIFYILLLGAKRCWFRVDDFVYMKKYQKDKFNMTYCVALIVADGIMFVLIPTAALVNQMLVNVAFCNPRALFLAKFQALPTIFLVVPEAIVLVQVLTELVYELPTFFYDTLSIWSWALFFFLAAAFSFHAFIVEFTTSMVAINRLVYNWTEERRLRMRRRTALQNARRH